MEPLTNTQLEEALERHRRVTFPFFPHVDAPQSAAAQQQDTDFKFVSPLAATANSYIEIVQNTDARFMTGYQAVDVLTRGFGRGELAYVTGRSHSGKTQFLLNALAQPVNDGKRVLFFTPDEPAELVLAKLVSIKHGMPAERVEQGIRTRDGLIISLVEQTASEDFRNLVIIDQGLSFDDMTVALREAEQMWQAEADAVIIDFLDLLPGQGTSEIGAVIAKSQALKRWTKQQDVTTLCLHQASRGDTNRGKARGLEAMRYGGETDAIFVLEVFRQRENTKLSAAELQRHQDSVTVNVAKNKRPPSKTGMVDFHLDAPTGRIFAYGGQQ